MMFKFDLALVANLFPAERAILDVIIRGDESRVTNKAIGRYLYISHKTVSNHLQHIYKKLNVRNRTQAAIVYLASQQKVEGAEEPIE